MIGLRIGSWILERELGHGGMGSVYEARHATLRTRAAVKVLSPGLESEESFRQRFHREAELQAELRHPNVARVLDYLEANGRWYLVIEYVDGGTLAEYVARKGKVSHHQAMTWARQALAGLGHAHQKGIIHRDVKPANLLIGANGEIVVMDFGIARSDAMPGLTATGATIGTPHYMSPEQIVSPDRVDRRSDIYSLGIVLYELLSGRKPFDSGSQFAILQAHVSEPPPPLRTIDPSIPPALEALVMRALAKKPEERYADCDAMIRELDRAAAVPATVPLGAPAVPIPDATIQSSRLFEPVALHQGASLSPGEARQRRRRAFQRKLAAGAAATAIAATVLAVQLSHDDPIKANDRPVHRTITPTQPDAQTEPETKTETAGTTAATQNTSSASAIAPVIPHIEIPKRPAETPRPVQEPTPEPAMTTPPKPSTQPPPPASAPPPPPMVLPEQPRIAVIGVGNKEPLLAGSLEEEMQRRLDSFDVADEHGDPAVSELLERKTKDISQAALGAALLKGGFHILVLLKVVEGDRKTVSPLGVEGSLIAARVHLNAYLLPANRPLGPGWTETVEYTEASAKGKARQLFIGPTADLRQAIRTDWAALRAAGAATR